MAYIVGGCALDLNEGQTGAATQVAESLETPFAQGASDTLSQYLANQPVEPELSAALTSTCEAPWALIGIGIGSQRGQSDMQEIQRIASNSPVQCVLARIDNIAIVFLSHSEVRHLLDGALEKGKPARNPICVSLPFESLEGIPQQLGLITYCLNESAAAGVRDARNSALAYLAAKIGGTISVDSLLHPALSILQHYDAANRSNLLNTLEVYLENDRNAQQCANKLYLHRNSLQYRVRRIQEIAGINLDDPAERSYLRLSFLLKS